MPTAHFSDKAHIITTNNTMVGNFNAIKVAEQLSIASNQIKNDDEKNLELNLVNDSKMDVNNGLYKLNNTQFNKNNNSFDFNNFTIITKVSNKPKFKNNLAIATKQTN